MTIPEMFDKFFLWLSEHQATALWIFIGAVVVILGVLWSSKKAREGLVAFARALLTTVWGIIFLVLFPVFACILIGVIAMLQGLGPWTICKIDNIVNDRSFLAECAPLSANTSTVKKAPQATQPPEGDANPAATQAIETFTNGGAYVVSLPSGATVRNACSSTATELGTIPTGSTVTLSTPVDSNCVDNANGDSVCQRATITAVDPLPSGFDPVGGCIHLAAVSPK